MIERNEVFHVCLETDDCGAFYMGRDPSERGNILRWNYFHHIGGAFGATSVGNNAVYFDDGASGNIVEGCIFYRCGNERMGAVFIHGGQKNRIVNCLFIDCRRAVGKNPWQNARWTKFITEEEPASKWKPAGIDPYAPPYITQYPDLKTLARVDISRIDIVERCIVVGCNVFLSPERYPGTGFASAANVELPTADIAPLLLDTNSGRLNPQAVAAVETKGQKFSPIPVTRIGLSTRPG